MGVRRMTTWYAAMAGAAVLALVLVAPPAAADGLDPGVVDRLVGQVSRLPNLRPVDLGVPGDSMAHQVSESGVVIGSTQDEDLVSRAFRWRDGEVELLPDEGRGSEAVAVNVHGQVAAYVDVPGGMRRAVLWEPDGTVVEIAPGAQWAYPAGIDDRGRVALNVSLGTDQVPRAAVWDDGELTLLEHGVISAVPQQDAMNARGQVLAVISPGITPPTWLPERLVLWDGGDEVTDLPAVPDAIHHPVSINERGDVLTRLVGPDGAITHAVWEGGRMRPVDAGRDGWLVDLDDRAVAVGQTMLHDGRSRGITISRDRVTRLPTLGGESSSAAATSGNGLVVGTAHRYGDVRRSQPALWLRGLPVPLGVGVTGLDTIGGQARDVNGHGRVVGGVTVVTGPGRYDWHHQAMLWDLLPRR